VAISVANLARFPHLKVILLSSPPFSTGCLHPRALIPFFADDDDDEEGDDGSDDE
jgi:hypothetical protein